MTKIKLRPSIIACGVKDAAHLDWYKRSSQHSRGRHDAYLWESVVVFGPKRKIGKKKTPQKLLVGFPPGIRVFRLLTQSKLVGKQCL